MMRFFALVVVALSFVSAQEVPNLSPEILTQVNAESLMSMRYLDLTLRFQKAMSWAQAGSMFTVLSIPVDQQQHQQQQQQQQQYGVAQEHVAVFDPSVLDETSDDDVSSDEFDSEGSDSEEFDLDSSEEEEESDSDDVVLLQEEGFTAPMGASQIPRTIADRSKHSLLAAFNFYSGVKYFYFQTLYEAHDVQQQYWLNRVRQLYFQANAATATPQQLQSLYFSAYATQIKTLKLAHQLQAISLLSTWLEDEIDILGALSGPEVRSADTAASGVMATDKKVAAFNVFHTYALLNMHSVYMDLYQLYTAGPGAAAAASSFVEVESNEREQFVSPTQGFDFSSLFPMMKVYHAYLLYSGVQAGANGANAEKMAADQIVGGDFANTDKLIEGMKFAQYALGVFGSSMLYASQIEISLASFEIYSFYSTAFGQPQQQHAQQ